MIRNCSAMRRARCAPGFSLPEFSAAMLSLAWPWVRTRFRDPAPAGAVGKSMACSVVRTPAARRKRGQHGRSPSRPGLVPHDGIIPAQVLADAAPVQSCRLITFRPLTNSFFDMTSASGAGARPPCHVAVRDCVLRQHGQRGGQAGFALYPCR